MKAIDTNTVITSDIAKQLKSSGIEAVGRYINRISQNEIDTIHKSGLGIFFYYETNPTYSGYFTPQQGIHDAQDAIGYAHKLNIPALVPIACTVDLDVNPADIPTVNAYVQAYRSHLNEYLDGLYGNYDVVSQIQATKKIQTYAWSGGKVFTNNSAYQHQNDVTLVGIQVDLVEINDEKIVWFGGNVMTRMLMIGAQGPDVKVLQSELNRTGAQLTVDGDFGPATQAAVKVFQKDRGLNPDGVVGPLTYAALEKTLAPKPIPTQQKPQEPPMPVEPPAPKPEPTTVQPSQPAPNENVVGSFSVEVLNDAMFFDLPITIPERNDVTGVGKMVFDTGAFEMLLSKNMADYLNLPNLGASKVAGVGGTVDAYNSEITVKLGNNEYKTPIVVDPSWNVMTGSVGLFGLRFFVDNDLDFTVDLDANQINIFKKVK